MITALTIGLAIVDGLFGGWVAHCYLEFRKEMKENYPKGGK